MDVTRTGLPQILQNLRGLATTTDFDSMTTMFFSSACLGQIMQGHSVFKTHNRRGNHASSHLWTAQKS
eukprot:10898896-Ditylum_brightwellii.AAC.1